MIADLKPYPEQRDSGLDWLGNVPSHWSDGPGFAFFREKKVKNIGLQKKTVLSLSYGKIIVKADNKLHGLVPESFETYQIVDPGDIIIRSTDMQNDKTSLRVGFVKNSGIITSAYMCMRATKSLLPEYGYLLLHTLDLTKVLYGLGSGLRQNLDFSDFKRLPLFVPPAYEQAAIVRFIDHINQRIECTIRAKRKVIALLNEQKQVIIHRAVTRGLDPNVRLKPSGITWLGEIPDHWELWRISRLAKVGNGSTPSRAKPIYWRCGSYPWLNSANVNRGFIDSADQFVTKIALQECHLPRVPAGSVLMAITGQGKTRGTAAVLGIEATINQHIAFITPRLSIVTPEFLHLALTAAYYTLRALSEDSGSTKGALTCEDLKRFKIAIPPLWEQAALAGYIQSATHALMTTISRTEREIELLREYRTRLIADVVTGKLDVRDAAARLPDEAEKLEFFDEINDSAEIEEMDAVAEGEA